ncbi:MAG: OmpA family protein [Rhodospirillaceae bacterium]
MKPTEHLFGLNPYTVVIGPGGVGADGLRMPDGTMPRSYGPTDTQVLSPWGGAPVVASPNLPQQPRSQSFLPSTPPPLPAAPTPVAATPAPSTTNTTVAAAPAVSVPEPRREPASAIPDPAPADDGPVANAGAGGGSSLPPAENPDAAPEPVASTDTAEMPGRLGADNRPAEPATANVTVPDVKPPPRPTGTAPEPARPTSPRLAAGPAGTSLSDVPAPAPRTTPPATSSGSSGGGLAAGPRLSTGRVPIPPPSGTEPSVAPVPERPDRPVVDNTPDAPADGEPQQVASADTGSSDEQVATRTAPPEAPSRMTISFEPGETDLPPSANDSLTRVAQVLKANPGFRVLLRAYASDPDKTVARAKRASLTRALNVRSKLMDEGIMSASIEVRAMGLDAGDDPDDPDRVDVQMLNR